MVKNTVRTPLNKCFRFVKHMTKLINALPKMNGLPTLYHHTEWCPAAGGFLCWPCAGSWGAGKDSLQVSCGKLCNPKLDERSDWGWACAVIQRGFKTQQKSNELSVWSELRMEITELSVVRNLHAGIHSRWTRASFPTIWLLWNGAGKKTKDAKRI